MSLTNLSKVTTSGIATGTSLLITNVNSSGVVTAASFSGPLSGDATGLSGTPNITVGVVTASSVTISGDLTVEGTYSTLDTILTEVDKLEVAANNSTVGVAITQSGTGDILNLFDGASEVFTVLDGGNVGIGTTIPSTNLEILRSAEPIVSNGPLISLKHHTLNTAYPYAGINLDHYNAGAGNQGGSFITFSNNGTQEALIQYDDDIGVNNGLLIKNNTDGPIYFQTNGANERVRITSSGNVGIGTDNPADSRLFINNTFNSTYSGSAYNDDFLLIKNSSTIASTAASIYMIASGDGNSAAVGTINLIHTGNGSGDLSFQTRYNGGMYERLRIATNGNVGIGTDNPRSKLDINGTDSELRFYRDAGDRFGGLRYTGSKLTLKLPTSDHFVVDDATGIEKVRITSTGSVGIGTDDPDNKLHVMGNVQVGKTEINGYETIISTNGVQFNRSSSSYIDQLGSGNLRFRYGAGYDIWMHMVGSTGNVGIGTDNPDKKLRVEGDARITGTLTMGTASVSIDGTVEYPSIRPTLDLNFAGTKILDDRITFYRDSVGTYTDEDGLVKYASNNTPRFDHDPTTGESLGLLIEESRTNLITTSEDFSSFDPNYSSARSTIASTTELAPDGTYTATKLVRTSGQGTGEVAILKNGISGVTSGNTYTSSLFVKYLSGSNSSVVSFNNVDSSSGESDSEFNLLTGAIVTEGNQHTTSIIPYPNGWYRIILSNRTASTNGAYFWIRSYNQQEGSGGFLLWGGQIEAGAFATSYIPTSGSPVTRAADFAKITGSNFTDFYNSTEGTLFAESSIADLTTANQGTVQLWYSGTDHIGMGYRWGGSGSGTYGFYIRNTSDELYRAPSGVTANTFVKASLAYKSGDGASSLNGETAYPDTSINLPTAATEMTIGYGNASPSTYRMKQGHIKSLKYYNKRLPNAQLQGLTQQ